MNSLTADVDHSKTNYRAESEEAGMELAGIYSLEAHGRHSRRDVLNLLAVRLSWAEAPECCLEAFDHRRRKQAVLLLSAAQTHVYCTDHKVTWMTLYVKMK